MDFSLGQLLEKIGVKDIDELSKSERQTYLQWQNALSVEQVTLEDLQKFIPTEIERAETELNKFDNSEKRDLYFKAYIRMCKMMEAFMQGPEKRKNWLISNIKNAHAI